MNKKQLGNDGENMAVDYLISKGVKIIDRNFYAKGGEIDVIFKDEDYLVFGEVKLRINTHYGDPLDAVNYKKIRRMFQTAQYYLYINKYPEDTKVRFDAIGILDGRINWIKNAFEL